MSDQTQISRRKVLTVLGGLATGTILAACSPSSVATPTSGSGGGARASTVPAGVPQPSAAFTPVATISSRSGGPVKLRIADTTTGGPGKTFTDGVWQRFMERFPNVTVEHTGTQLDQYRTALPLAIKSGQEADVFLGPFWLPLYRPVKEGWFKEIGPLLGDDFRKSFPAELFEEGTTVFNGKIYALSNQAFQPGGFLYYNKNLLRKAGLDPEQPPKTWSELREQARLVTQAGRGEFFGFVEGGKQLNRFMDDAGYLACNAGGHAAQPGFQRWNYKTGLMEYDSDAYQAAVELLLSIKGDNSYIPGFMNMTGNDAVDQYRQQTACFFIYGPWNVQDFLENKEIDFGVTALPSPDSGRKGFLQYPRQAITVSFLSPNSKAPDMAVELMKFRWGPETMTEFVKAGLGSSAISYVNKPENYPSKQAAAVGQLVTSERRVPPDVIRRNPEQSAVLESYKDPSPDIQRLLQGVMSGQVSDYRSVAKDLSDKMNAELDRAIKAAQSGGAKVRREDWVFPNWDPMQDYGDEEYKALT